MSNFTEGEWRTLKSTNAGVLLVRDIRGEEHKISIGGPGEDVYLMSASKDMYEAIDKLLNCISETRGSDAREAVDLAEKALAKARGEA